MVLGSDPNLRLIDILDEEVIVRPLQSTSKWDAIGELVGKCREAGRLSPEQVEEALNAVVHREETMSTGLEHGIAIPHGATPAVDEIIAALGVSPEGLDFDSVDRQPTHIVLLMVIPKNKFQKHIRTLAAISRLLNHEGLRSQIVDASTPKDVMDAIREAEKTEFL